MKLLGIIIKFLNKIIMALENKKLSSYDDLASANIDTTTKLVVLTGATKVNNNLPVTNFIEDTLTSTSTVKPLSARQGKTLQDTKAPIANPTFTGTVGGVTKAMVGLGNVDNTSDANKPISTAQAAGLAPKESPTFTGVVRVPTANYVNESPVPMGLFSGRIPEPVEGQMGYVLTAGFEETATWQDKFNEPVFTGLQVFADNAAAAALAAGTMYRTPTGQLMIKY